MAFDFEAVIFDCDGVLIDSEIRMTELWVRELNALGCSFTPESYASQMLGLAGAEYLRELRSMPAGRDLALDALLKIQRRQIEVLAGVPPVAGMLAVVEAVGDRRCVASGSSPERLTATLDGAGYSGLFPGRVFSTTVVERGKPAPDIFLYAAQQLGIEPERCVVIEDSPHGVAGAKAAGMRAVGFAGASHMFPAVVERLKGSGIDDFASDAEELRRNLGL